MNIIKDLRSIRSGEKKAKLDIALDEQYETMHDLLHKTIGTFDCASATAAHRNHIGKNVNPNIDPVEYGAYLRAFQAHESKTDAHSNGLVIDMDGVTSPGEAMQRIKDAIKTDIAFRAVVSETQDPDTKNKKGGK